MRVTVKIKKSKNKSTVNLWTATWHTKLTRQDRQWQKKITKTTEGWKGKREWSHQYTESTSGWLPSRGGCDPLYPPKFATASWPIVPSTAAELPRCTATESLCLYSELAMTNIIPSCFWTKYFCKLFLQHTQRFTIATQNMQWDRNFNSSINYWPIAIPLLASNITYV